MPQKNKWGVRKERLGKSGKAERWGALKVKKTPKN